MSKSVFSILLGYHVAQLLHRTALYWAVDFCVFSLFYPWFRVSTCYGERVILMFWHFATSLCKIFFLFFEEKGLNQSSQFKVSNFLSWGQFKKDISSEERDQLWRNWRFDDANMLGGHANKKEDHGSYLQ